MWRSSSGEWIRNNTETASKAKEHSGACHTVKEPFWKGPAPNDAMWVGDKSPVQTHPESLTYICEQNKAVVLNHWALREFITK